MSATPSSRPSSAPSEDRVRLFVALELPAEVREALVRWRGKVLQSAVGMRPIAAEALHATLCFLGWRRAAEIEAIRDACGVVAAQPAPDLVLGGSLWLPPRRPRVLAVELSDETGALTKVQASLTDLLTSGGWYTPEKRPYLAHVTVARFSGARASSRPLPTPPSLAFRAPRVTLYRSRLLRGGARYAPLETVELAG